jgi:hypothetical protein
MRDQQPTAIREVIPMSGRLFCWLDRYGDTTQMRHSMPQEAAEAGSLYSAYTDVALSRVPHDKLRICHTDFPQSLLGLVNWQVFMITLSTRSPQDIGFYARFRGKSASYGGTGISQVPASVWNTCQLLHLQGNRCVTK